MSDDSFYDYRERLIRDIRLITGYGETYSLAFSRVARIFYQNDPPVVATLKKINQLSTRLGVNWRAVDFDTQYPKIEFF